MLFYALTIHPQKVPVLNINYLDSNEIKIIISVPLKLGRIKN